MGKSEAMQHYLTLEARQLRNEETSLEEYDALLDEMDKAWWKLTDEERDQLDMRSHAEFVHRRGLLEECEKTLKKGGEP